MTVFVLVGFQRRSQFFEELYAWSIVRKGRFLSGVGQRKSAKEIVLDQDSSKYVLLHFSAYVMCIS